MKELLIHAVTEMNCMDIMLSKINQTKRVCTVCFHLHDKVEQAKLK